MPRNNNRHSNGNAPIFLLDEEFADNELVSNKKITYKLKPFPVQKTLSKKYYELIKNIEKLDCPICYDEICCDKCFTLMSCGHYYHRDCVDNCLTSRCSMCNI